MFLDRKFRSPDETAPPRRLPAPFGDVVDHLDRVLAAERGISHLLPDYGLSRSGAWSVEGVLAHAAAELTETLPRYEPRLAIEALEPDVDDAGRPIVIVTGRIAGARVKLTIDPLARCVRALAL